MAPLGRFPAKRRLFLFLRRGKNQHTPALHLLNMRHAATQTRPGVCRIHFHLRHLIVSRRSPCSGGHCPAVVTSAVHVWYGRVLAAASADRLGELSGFRALVFVDFTSLAFIGSVLHCLSPCRGRRWKWNMFSYLAVYLRRADVRSVRYLLE